MLSRAQGARAINRRNRISRNRGSKAWRLLAGAAVATAVVSVSGCASSAAGNGASSSADNGSAIQASKPALTPEQQQMREYLDSLTPEKLEQELGISQEQVIASMNPGPMAQAKLDLIAKDPNLAELSDYPNVDVPARVFNTLLTSNDKTEISKIVQYVGWGNLETIHTEIINAINRLQSNQIDADGVPRGYNLLNASSLKEYKAYDYAQVFALARAYRLLKDSIPAKTTRPTSDIKNTEETIVSWTGSPNSYCDLNNNGQPISPSNIAILAVDTGGNIVTDRPLTTDELKYNFKEAGLDRSSLTPGVLSYPISIGKNNGIGVVGCDQIKDAVPGALRAR